MALPQPEANHTGEITRRLASDAPARVPQRADFERLSARYRIEESRLDLVDNPRGAWGYFSMSGDFTPPVGRRAGDSTATPGAVAEAFIAAEFETFGLSEATDLQPGTSRTDDATGDTRLEYCRLVGDLALKDFHLGVVIDARGSITSVEGYLVPLPSELFEAATQPTITEADARAIALRELTNQGHDPNGPATSERFAMSEPPYIVFRVTTAAAAYTIDAFTGAITTEAVIQARPPAPPPPAADQP